MTIKKYSVILSLLIAALVGCAPKKAVLVIPEVIVPENNNDVINEAKLLEEFEKNIGNEVFFALDRYSLSSEAEVQLQKQAEWLKMHPEAIANIEGHCDERGSKVYNVGLGLKRAQAVKKYLIQQGVTEGKLHVTSQGEEKPKVLGHNKSAWKKNRRVVTRITIKCKQ